ncbi:MAG: glycoside hydrolase family 26 protein [Micromonosporaceae bacterium]
MTVRPGFVVTVVGLVVSGLLAGCSVPGDAPLRSRRPGPSAPPRPPPTPFPPPGKVFLGVQTSAGPPDFTAVDAFTAATHHGIAAFQFSQGWAEDGFDAGRLDAVAAKGLLPIVSWEPWDYQLRGRAASSGEQPAYRLATIIDGRYDDYIRSWATGVATLPYPVVMRFAHEMNGFWYPWCEQANGNHPGDYVKAWRHVHDIFVAAGAHNVSWLWSPNVTYPGAAPLDELYPGDSYVDWIGLSGYYGTAGHTSYISFDQIFDRTITELSEFTRKPIVVTETGATNSTGQQTRWITQMFQQLPRHPEIIGVIWFEVDKEIDWRIAGVPSSAAAFATGAADPRYDTTWTPAGVPRSG